MTISGYGRFSRKRSARAAAREPRLARRPGRARLPPRVSRRGPGPGCGYGVGAGGRTRGDQRRRSRERAGPHGDGGSDPDRAELREGPVSGDLRRPEADTGLRAEGCAVRAGFRGRGAPRHRRPRRGRRTPLPHPDRRADGVGGPARVPGQVPSAPAREMARSDRRRDPIPATVPGPDRQPRVSRGVRGARPGAGVDPAVPGTPGSRLSRGRDADDAADRGRGPGPAVRDPSQRAGHGPVPADRPGALSQAAGRRRDGARLRDQPELPERGHLDAAQPGVHDARVLLGLPRLPRPDDHDRAPAGDGGAGRRAIHPGRHRRRRRRLRRARRRR